MTLIEIVAVAFGLTCVWLTIRQNIWCWPAGLVQVALYIVIFYQVKLYSNLMLHILYVGLQLYGWHHWLRGGKNQSVLPVSVLGWRSRLAWPAAATALTVCWGYFMSRYTDAAVPYGDAFTSVTSLVAQWLMARKQLESWFFWIAVDVVAIGIYWQQGLQLTSGLYAVFLILAALGWHEWRKSLAEPGQVPA